jgi:hypothetical protein
MTDSTTVAAPALGRRGLLSTARLVALGAVAAPLVQAGPAEAATVTDADILNFALNLEYLEAEFYLRGATGRGLMPGEIEGRGSLGPVTGGRKVSFKSSAIRSYAREIAEDEHAHVRFLRSALGGAAVARPAIDLDRSFTLAARAAGLVGPGQRFDAFANETNFLLAAFLFEDVGVTAYKGAAPLITDRAVLEAAAGLLAVEAYHAGEIRSLLYSRGLFTAARAISDARDALDGPGDKDQGLRRENGANIVPTDMNGLAFSRSTSEVLNIVYLGGASGGFGFFPNRVNGLIM